MQIVGRKFTHVEFRNYVAGLVIEWPKTAQPSEPPKFVVVHNTSAPDIALYNKWIQRPGWTPEQWLKNLTSYYAGMGWKGTPHLFIPPVPDQILVLNDLRQPGTHTPSWNKVAIGVETVGEFEREPFVGATKDNLVFALATLHSKLGLDPADYQIGVKGLHFHKEDRNTTHKTCPGRNMVKSDLVRDVMAAMGKPSVPEPEPESHVHVPIPAQEADTNGMSIQELTSVRWLQVSLNKWDPSLKLVVDGIIAPKPKNSPTRNAVIEFQKSEKLTVDGIAGPVTRSRLKKLVG